MKTLLTNNYILLICTLTTVGMLFTPTWTRANTVESSSYSYSETETTGNGTAHIEISHTSVVNGEQTTYSFSTTSTGSIQHQVEIEDGKVITDTTTRDIDLTQPEELLLPLSPSTNTFATAEQIAEAEDIRWLLELINYLYFLYAE